MATFSKSQIMNESVLLIYWNPVFKYYIDTQLFLNKLAVKNFKPRGISKVSDPMITEANYQIERLLMRCATHRKRWLILWNHLKSVNVDLQNAFHLCVAHKKTKAIDYKITCDNLKVWTTHYKLNYKSLWLLKSNSFWWKII